MGVGLPEDLVASVERGMDMFDCVIPTRYAREGTLFTWDGKMRIKDKRYRKDRTQSIPRVAAQHVRADSRARTSGTWRSPMRACTKRSRRCTI